MTDIQVSKIDQKRPVFVRMQNGRKIKINQPNSNLFSLTYRPKKLSKSKLESSKTPRNPSPKRDPVDLDTTRRLVLVSIKTPFYVLSRLYRFQNPTICHRGSLRRQEVPIHLRCHHQRKNLQVSYCVLNILIICFRGVVLSAKMSRTVVLRRDYLHYIKKYNRFEKRHHNLPAHCAPCFARTKTGDVVTVGQCRPLSKTVRFNVIRVEKKRIEGNVRKTFVMF